jgi:hypothetical protein
MRKIKIVPLRADARSSVRKVTTVPQSQHNQFPAYLERFPKILVPPSVLVAFPEDIHQPLALRNVWHVVQGNMPIRQNNRLAIDAR